jgi:hypothetical protein
MNLHEDMMFLIFEQLSIKDLARCERVCKLWSRMIVQHDAVLWKNHLFRIIQIQTNCSPQLITNWINRLRLASCVESWKSVYRVREEWNKIKLNDPNGILVNKKPRLIRTNPKGQLQNQAAVNTSKGRFRVGQVEGKFHTPKGLHYPFKICFELYSRGAYEIDLSDWDFHTVLNAKPCHFKSDGQISFVSNYRSDLEVVQESFHGNEKRILRIWDPKIIENPWISDFYDLDSIVSGLWIICGVFEFVNLCGRKLVLGVIDENRAFGKVLVLDLQEHNRWKIHKSGTLELQFTKNVYFKWVNYFCLDEHKLCSISMNESIVAILRKHKVLGKLDALMFNLDDGTTYAVLEPKLPILNGFESAFCSFLVTRFHLIVYNCHFLIVYDLLHCNRESLDPPITTLTKLPYLGRNVRIETSEDASMFILAPLIQHGEVVLIDVLKRSCTSYLLQNGYVGTSPKKGCWMVFEKWKDSKSDPETRVVWSPI